MTAYMLVSSAYISIRAFSKTNGRLLTETESKRGPKQLTWDTSQVGKCILIIVGDEMQDIKYDLKIYVAFSIKVS